MTEQLTDALTAIDAACTNPLADFKWQAMARGMMRGYDLRYRDVTEFTPESVEDEFRVPIYNLNTPSVSKSRTFEQAGKIDIMSRDHNSNRWIIDHKTCSEDIGPEATYWQHLAVDAQPSGYLLAEHVSGRHVSGAVWDVIRKLGIAPKAVTKANCKAIASLAVYCGESVSEQTQAGIVDHPRENAELYEIRVFVECRDNPDRYFARRRVPRLQHHIIEYADELWELTQEILTTRRRHKQTDILPVRNSGACMSYGLACNFLGLCSGYDSPDSDRWRIRENVHNELNTIEGDGRNVLTHSRLRCFQTCKRKHYYQYDLGIERQDRPLSDALYFGTIMHAGLEAWWKHLLPQGDINGNSNTGAEPQSGGNQSTQDDLPF